MRKWIKAIGNEEVSLESYDNKHATLNILDWRTGRRITKTCALHKAANGEKVFSYKRMIFSISDFWEET